MGCCSRHHLAVPAKIPRRVCRPQPVIISPIWRQNCGVCSVKRVTCPQIGIAVICSGRSIKLNEICRTRAPAALHKVTHNPNIIRRRRPTQIYSRRAYRSSCQMGRNCRRVRIRFQVTPFPVIHSQVISGWRIHTNSGGATSLYIQMIRNQPQQHGFAIPAHGYHVVQASPKLPTSTHR